MLRLNVIKINQRKIDLYVTAIKASDLLLYAKVDYWHEKNPEGYQRPLLEQRIVKAVKYLLYEEGTFPTSVLVNVRGRVDFTPACDIDGFGKFGLLTIPDSSLPLWIIDGQHRLMAIKLAAREDPAYEDYPIPISILTLMERYDEMRQFYIVNSRQKAVPTSLAQRHLEQAIKKVGMEGVTPYESKRKVMAAIAIPIVDILRTEPSSPWYGKVLLPSNHKRSQNYIISQTSLADSIGKALSSLTREEHNKIMENPRAFASILINYWNALKEIFPEAFILAQDYTIQKTIGCYVFHMIFPHIYELCKSNQDFSKAKIKEILTKMFENFCKNQGIKKLNSEFWNRWAGHPMAIGTGMKTIKKLANLFSDSLPPK